MFFLSLKRCLISLFPNTMTFCNTGTVFWKEKPLNFFGTRIKLSPNKKANFFLGHLNAIVYYMFITFSFKFNLEFVSLAINKLRLSQLTLSRHSCEETLEVPLPCILFCYSYFIPLLQFRYKKRSFFSKIKKNFSKNSIVRFNRNFKKQNKDFQK